MLSTLLLAVLVAAPRVASPSLDLSGGARLSPVVGIVEFGSGPNSYTAADCSGPTTLVATKPAGGTITHTRVDASLCCPLSDAACCAVAINQPCIHAPTYAGSLGGAGVEVYGAGANALKESQTFATANAPTSPWIANAGVAVLADQCAGPSTTTMDLIDSSGAGNTTSTLYQTVTVTNSTGPWTHSVWVAATSGTADLSVGITVLTAASTCTCGRSDGGSCTAVKSGTNCVAWGNVGTTPVRMWATATDTNATSTIYPVLTGGKYGTSKGAGCFDMAQLTPTAAPVPYRATTGTAYLAASGTVLSTPVVLTNPAQWCLLESATPSAAPGITGRLWSLGTTGANYAYLNGFYFGIFDAANAQKYLSLTSEIPAGVGTQKACVSSGTLSYFRNGTQQVISPSGAGSGVQTSLPAAVYLGCDGAGAQQINGTIARTVQCRSGGPRCK